MRSARAVFVKQAKDMIKNPVALIPFLLFPAVALIMTLFVAKGNDDIPDNLFVTMMSAIFAGFALLQSSAAAISEDIEKKSLRFLVMAGVKPHQYLLGVGGFILTAGTVASVIFGIIGGFSGADFIKFMAVMVTSAIASVTLGASIGMVSKNQQAAAAMAMPAAVIFGFTPMIASFNKTVEQVASILYTQQLNVIVNDFSANFPKAMAIIGANIAVFMVLFVVVYREKGLRG